MSETTARIDLDEIARELIDAASENTDEDGVFYDGGRDAMDAVKAILRKRFPASPPAGEGRTPRVLVAAHVWLDSCERWSPWKLCEGDAEAQMLAMRPGWEIRRFLEADALPSAPEAGEALSREPMPGEVHFTGTTPFDRDEQAAPEAEGAREVLLRERFRKVIDRLSVEVGELAPRSDRVERIGAAVREGMALLYPVEVDIDEHVEVAARAMARANDDGCFEDHDRAVANADLMSRESFDEAGAGEEDREYYRVLASAALLTVPPAPEAREEDGR